ncbi:xanthine dehydrogenase subunit XdhB [Agrilactobacillus yilanensis]|uniref:Xanthine dehydrogenase subunit XdhB n=1 Tax=Agrilactobacillus yilanensis TaxID=2485997 RepID=A0ABW4J9V0_9LACO|nr:xanthine dehydrogenase subunit XdhB [Agrilactobacillus yilanensis]
MYDITGYNEAKSLQDVFDLIKEDPKARLIAGGTDVLVKSRERKEGFVDAPLIGITRIPDLQDIYLDDDETLVIGSMNSFTDVETNPLVKEHAPLLSEAVALVGGPQTRNAGTIGGNVCNGATSADSAPTLFAYNAVLEIHSPNGVKNVPIAEFYKGAGWVDLEPGDILVKIKIAKADYEGYQGHYTKFAQRHALDIANLSCACLLKVENDVIEDLRVCFGVAAPTPIRMAKAEAYAKGKAISEETMAEIGKLCLEDTNTRNSWRASKEYRDHLVQILPGRNIMAAIGEA